jgi:hypothetical protein
VNDFDEEAIQALYGRWSPLDPAGVAALLDGSGVRWWIVGGRAARVGAPPRHHEDTDVAIRLADLPALRRHLTAWHLWQPSPDALRPLLPGADLHPGQEQLWLRRNAHHPWVLDLPLQRGDEAWVFKKDARVRLPWDRALHEVDGVRYLRPELALLHKAHLNRRKDREDLAVAALTDPARAWLAETLELLGHHEWASAVVDPDRRARPEQADRH